MQLQPVAVTSVGSFPRPSWLGQTARSEVTFRLTGDALREAEDDATIVCLHEQEELGIDLVTDGEQRRSNFISHVTSGLEGIDFTDMRMKAIRRRPGSERPVARIAGKVSRRGPIVVDDLRFAKAHTGLPVKMTVPGPMTVIDSTYDDHYGDEPALSMDIAAALNQELLELQAAGADVLQIDEPAMTRYHEKVAEYGAKALDRCVQGVTVPTIVHLCYGYPGGGERQHYYEYPELLAMLMETKIAGFSVEFARSGYDPSVVKHCGDRLVMFGCIDPGDTRETRDTVITRVRGALQHIDPAKLMLAPDCGLMTIDRQHAREKVATLVGVARTVRAG